MIFLRLCLDLLPPLALGTGKTPSFIECCSLSEEKLDASFRSGHSNSSLLFIGYQFTNILRFNRSDHRRVPQMPLSLLALARENVTFIAFVALDLTTAGDAKSFRRRSISFNFGHFSLL